MADRLISADALKRKLCRRKNSITDTYGKNDAWVICLNEVLERIDEAPTIEPKCGRWEKNGEITMFGDIPVKCSQCGFKTLQDALHRMDYHYCPNCGAEMQSTMGQVKPTEGVNEALRHALRADQTWAEYTLQGERMDEAEE